MKTVCLNERQCNLLHRSIKHTINELMMMIKNRQNEIKMLDLRMSCNEYDDHCQTVDDFVKRSNELQNQIKEISSTLQQYQSLQQQLEQDEASSVNSTVHFV